jgi:serine/threonine protein kinase
VKSLGKYRVVREIGRGAMGTVYLGHDPFQDQDVALKVARREHISSMGGDDLFEALFYNETRTAGLLSHPSIVQVFDAGTDGDHFYIAMEYVPDAHTLDAYCHRGRLLQLERVAEVVFKCAEALDHAHRKGVIHRDVKPSNILLAPGGAVKVVDFSVALLVDPQAVETQLMLPAGSPLYMAPEQIREEAITGQADLFALGAVLYELVTGTHPFVAETFAGLTHRILYEPHRPVKELRPDAPESLCRIVDRALAKERAERYATALDFAADLSLIFSELHFPQDGVATEGRAETLMRLPFFESFPDAEIWELLRWAEWREFAIGESIVREGQTGHALYILVEGEVSVHKGGGEIARLGAGVCIGEIAYLGGQRRTATVVAETPTCALRMNADILERASSECQRQFQRVFIRTLIDRLVETTSTLARFSAAEYDPSPEPEH